MAPPKYIYIFKKLFHQNQNPMLLLPKKLLSPLLISLKHTLTHLSLPHLQPFNQTLCPYPKAASVAGLPLSLLLNPR